MLVNFCGDFFFIGGGGRGNVLSEFGFEGGSLWVQSVRSNVSDGYQFYDGVIIRINKDGSVLGDNLLVGGSNVYGNDDFIVVFGLCNLFCFQFKLGMQELWIGDVGVLSREEVSYVVVGVGNIVFNFGWFCFEGNDVLFDFGVKYGHSYNLCGLLVSGQVIFGFIVISLFVEFVVVYGYQGVDWNMNIDVGCKLVTVGSDFGLVVVGGGFVIVGDWFDLLNGVYVWGDYGCQCLWVLIAMQQ